MKRISVAVSALRAAAFVVVAALILSPFVPLGPLFEPLPGHAAFTLTVIGSNTLTTAPPGTNTIGAMLTAGGGGAAVGDTVFVVAHTDFLNASPPTVTCADNAPSSTNVYTLDVEAND